MPVTGRDLAEQLGWHWSTQLRPRLDGLTDDEYLWRPVPGAWSVHARPDGGHAPDLAFPVPEPPPFTTIGWRTCHVWMVLAQRADFHFGEGTLTDDRLDWPGTAAAALDALDGAYASWTTGLASCAADAWDRASAGPPGTADGHFPFWAVVLHVNREVIHHGAEIALLRDLYAAQAESAGGPAERQASASPGVVHVDVRTITVGDVHAEPGDPHKVAVLHAWLLANPDRDLPALDVRVRDDGTYRVHDGRHRFLAYVLAQRALVPVRIGTGGVSPGTARTS